MPKLGVNVDHIATIRQARRTFEPDPARAAVICETAGAAGVVAHLREDRRHIQERDIELIKMLINIKLNLEMAATDEMIEKSLQILPAQATLVPERREELTTEGGLDVVNNEKKILKAAGLLQKKGIIVSIFVAPDLNQIKSAAQTGADAVEIHTGAFAESFIAGNYDKELKQLHLAVELAKKTGFIVHAGHGLTYLNTDKIAKMPGIEELNIGHSIISRAVFTGLFRAVKDMLELISPGGRG